MMRTIATIIAARNATTISQRPRPHDLSPPLPCCCSWNVVIGPPPLSMRLANRLDQVPLAHLRAAGDLLRLGDLVELLPVAVLQCLSGLAAPLAAFDSLLDEAAACLLRQMRDRPLPRRRRLRL